MSPQPSSTAEAELDATVPSIADLEAAPIAAPTAISTNSEKSPEQLAKEKRIAELKNETLLDHGYGPVDGGILDYAPEFAIATVALMFLFIVSDERKPTVRTGWRAWLRGRF